MSATLVLDRDWSDFWNAGTNGWVYFVQQGDDGPIKIGFARDIAKRLEALQIGNAHELHVRLALRGTQKDEHAYHSDFDYAHIRGEWFEPCIDLLDFIRNLQDDDEDAQAA